MCYALIWFKTEFLRKKKKFIEAILKTNNKILGKIE